MAAHTAHRSAGRYVARLITGSVLFIFCVFGACAAAAGNTMAYRGQVPAWAHLMFWSLSALSLAVGGLIGALFWPEP